MIDIQTSVNELEKLEQFSTDWNASETKMEEVWKQYRLLPLNAAYLIASHYHYDRFGWSITTKWNLYKQFDQLLIEGKETETISASIASAIQTQQKIVALEKVFAVIHDDTKTLQDQACALDELKNSEVYQDLLHKLSVANATHVVSIDPTTTLLHKVIQEMLFLYREGYPTLDDHYFTKLSPKS